MTYANQWAMARWIFGLSKAESVSRSQGRKGALEGHNREVQAALCDGRWGWHSVRIWVVPHAALDSRSLSQFILAFKTLQAPPCAVKLIVAAVTRSFSGS